MPFDTTNNSTPTTLAPYVRRTIKFRGLEVYGAWTLKVYGIAPCGQQVRATLVEATLNLLPTALPRDPSACGRSGVGIVIVHDAPASGFGLIYWWENGNELHQRVYAAPCGNPRTLQAVENPPAGCVWELEVLDFERRAWLSNVLTRSPAPDLAAYIESRHETIL